MKISGVAEQIDLGKDRVPSLGMSWLESSAKDWNSIFDSIDREHVIDLSQIAFVNLFEWITVIAMMEKAMSGPSMPSFQLDLIGNSQGRVLEASEFLRNLNIDHRNRDLSVAPGDIDLSKRVYRVAGFLEALGTRYVLNNYNQRASQVFYPGIMKDNLELRNFYKSKTNSGHTVVLGITRIDSEEDCKQFLDEHRILRWKEAMGKRFPNSPLFESEEVWRVLCHELAVNIFEHARISGFISARVVQKPLIKTGQVRPWCLSSFGEPINDILPRMSQGFLELCVADAGQGIMETLSKSFSERTNIPIENTSIIDVLAFAFDEIGTCKSEDESWATERHALGRILRIVAKYGGAIRIRSGGAELVYQSQGGRFERQRDRLGYVPQLKRILPYALPGVQIQMILPLIPFYDSSDHRESRSILETVLPESFRTQANQVRGHLVPLLETLNQPEACIGKDERREFRQACTRLSRQILERRPRGELLVFDFSGLRWTEGQFETLLHLLQNVIQTRPVLLVAIDPMLARAVEQIERESGTTLLKDDILVGAMGGANKSFSSLSETRFLETYSRVHSTVLGLDSHGREYLFGLLDFRYKEPLLTLIEREISIDDLCNEQRWDGRLKESVLRTILNAANPLFKVSYKNSRKGLWRTIWDKQALAQEASRVISFHFDDVARRSEAWRGGFGKVFYLPWIAQWRDDFLESSRILSRSRQVDEIAQRLIYRLRLGLESRGRRLEDVRVLACVTTPAMLLASAIHRWWPTATAPAVADLGYYVMLSEPKDIPIITASGGGVVVVQDVLDTNSVSTGLVNVLEEQGVEVLCVLAFVRLQGTLRATRATMINAGWDSKDQAVPRHALIETRRPNVAIGPSDEEDDSKAFWVEPRSLHPIRYTTLRREFEPGRDLDLDRRDLYLQRFDNPATGCLITAGHYVFGRRHYVVTIDVRRALTGEIGEAISRWLADVCEGLQRSRPEEWERGFSLLNGEVTAVLMPLHSQVHYLWPKVENLLAQRGRRQPNWWLEATLFTGAGPSYFLPAQFRYQIEQSVADAVKSKKGPGETIDHPLRILIVDDGIATARTLETILTTILRVVEKTFDKLKKTPNECPKPIEWIRYFAVLNQMGYAHHLLWHNVSKIGTPPITIVFEEFAPFMGVPVYDDENCPLCRDQVRLKLLSSKCDQISAVEPKKWVDSRINNLRPVAVDSADFQARQHTTLPEPIDVLAPRSRPKSTAQKYLLTHADTAIWRFYELMYLSYPVHDVLASLNLAHGPSSCNAEQRAEYDRYRWSVLEWCIHHWPRVKANAARRYFVNAVLNEVEANTPLVPRVFEAAAVHYRDSDIGRLVKKIIGKLARFERQREVNLTNLDDRAGRAVNLDTSLSLFFLNVPTGALRSPDGEAFRLLRSMRRLARTIDQSQTSLLRNLYRTLTRPQRSADPKWSLETFAETVFRGRDSQDVPAGNHKLLPRLISDVTRSSGGDQEERRLLNGSIALFLTALKEIEPYCDLDLAAGASEIKVLCSAILNGLKHPAKSPQGRLLLSDLTDLFDELLPNGEFCQNFNTIFHREVGELGPTLEKWASDKGGERFKFSFVPMYDSNRCRVLTNVHELLICLSNMTIDRISEKPASEIYQSRVEVFHTHHRDSEDRLKFRLLTNFDSLAETQLHTSQGPSGSAERSLLAKFGAQFDEMWSPPSAQEKASGFTASFELSVMAGFVPRSER